jgi:integrase
MDSNHRRRNPADLGDEAAVLESLAGRLEGRKAELVRHQDEQNPPLPVSKAWIEYLNAPNRPDSGEATLDQYSYQFGQFANWIKEKHGENFVLRDVTKEVAEEYAAQLNHGRLSASTFNKHRNLLLLVFRVLKHKGRLTSNPWEEINTKRIAQQGRRELTIDELKKVCQSATGELRSMLALGLYSGLRLGDCATLRWGEVDLARGVILRIANKTGRRNPKPVTVPIHQVLRDVLSQIPKDAGGEYVLPETAALYLNRRDLVTDKIQKHLISCGIATHKPGTGKDGIRAVVEAGFHSLRHSFVSLCRASGAPLSVVESIVGHSSPAMTRHYTHTGELEAAKSVALLPMIYGEATPIVAKRDAKALLQSARTIITKITAKNWREQKAALLKITDV